MFNFRARDNDFMAMLQEMQEEMISTSMVRIIRTEYLVASGCSEYHSKDRIRGDSASACFVEQDGESYSIMVGSRGLNTFIKQGLNV